MALQTPMCIRYSKPADICHSFWQSKSSGPLCLYK